MTAARAPAVVIGLGNSMRHDDGVGPAAVARLADQPLAGADVVALDGEATRLIEAWRDRRTAIVVDAIVRGGPPGTVHEIEVGRDPMPGWDTGGGTHAAGLAEAVALGRALDRLPAELVVLGVEPGDLSFGPGLSAPVAAALDSVVRRVRERSRR